MKSLFIAFLLSTTGAHTTPPAQVQNCTVKEYKAYAAKVYKRKEISDGAHTKLHQMISCLSTDQQKKAASKYHKKYKKARIASACSQSNPVACIYNASEHYGVLFSWLRSCAYSESGFNPYKMNSQGSGAGGLFQFMPSTYSSTLSRMGVSPKPFFSAEWQSNAAAWKFKHDGSGEWTGAGC